MTHSYDVYAQSMHVVFSALWLLASRSNEEALPLLEDDVHSLLEASYGQAPSPADNDGVVPTLSQVWGPVLHAVSADHLDVVGHYGAERMVDGVHADWLPADSGFDDEGFETTWRKIADFIAEAATDE
jgi:hypothetical protein